MRVVRVIRAIIRVMISRLGCKRERFPKGLLQHQHRVYDLCLLATTTTTTTTTTTNTTNTTTTNTKFTTTSTALL